MSRSWGKAPRHVGKPVSLSMIKEHASGYLEHADAGVAEMARHIFRLAHEMEARTQRYLRLESACIKLGNGDGGKSAQAIAREALQHDRRGGVHDGITGPLASQYCVSRLLSRIEALEKTVAWWNECKRFEDGKVEP